MVTTLNIVFFGYFGRMALTLNKAIYAKITVTFDLLIQIGLFLHDLLEY